MPGCAGPPAVAPSYASGAPATVAYMLGDVDTAIKGYSAVPANNGSLLGTLTYPSSYYGGPLATDSTGQIYAAVAINPVDPLNLGDIFIYPPNSTGGGTPSRTININSYQGSALAVDSAGLVYVAINTGSAEDAPPPMVSVYSATASGIATPLRTLQLTNVFPTGVTDIAADAAGNIYVAGCTKTMGFVIAIYPPTATGSSTAARTITFGSSAVFGVAVNATGNIFANVCSGCYSGPNFVIEEFAPGADGEATPINTISLPAESGWINAGGGPVRLDGAGNIFTSLQRVSTNPSVLDIDVVYGFESTATGNSAPTVQIAPPKGYNNFFALN